MPKGQLFAHIMKYAIVSIAVSFVSFAHAKESEAHRTETESEISITLTESAFKKISAALNLGVPTHTRVDTYFDVARNGAFLRKSHTPEAKQRIQKKSNTLILQKSWLLSQIFLKKNGFTFSVSEKVSSKRELNQKASTTGKLEQSHIILTAGLNQNGISQDQKRYLEKLWAPLKWPSLSELDAAVKPYSGKLVPSAVVTKNRWKVDAESVKGGTFKVQIGSDSNTLGEESRTYYELDSELSEGTENELHDRTESISDFLTAHGVRPAETSEYSDHDFYDDLEKIYP